MFLRIGKNMERRAIFLYLGWGGEIIVLLLVCGMGDIFFDGMKEIIFLEARVSINAVTRGLMINGYDEVSIKNAPLS